MHQDEHRDGHMHDGGTTSNHGGQVNGFGSAHPQANGNGHANGNGNGNGHANGNGHRATPMSAIPAQRRHPGAPRVSVVIPTLNEAKNLPHVLSELPEIVDELVIVDGNSTDDTIAVVKEYRPDARIIMESKPGKGNALLRGFHESTGDIIVMLDADGSMTPADIPVFVAVLMSGADVAKGSRFIQGAGTEDMGPLRYLGNFVLRQAVRVAFGGRYSDLCYGYMGFWRHVLPTFRGTASGFEVETFLNVRALAAGLRIVEVPTFEARRIHGESHLRTFRDGSRVLRTIVQERRELTRSRAGRGVPRPHVSFAAAPAGVVLPETTFRAPVTVPVAPAAVQVPTQHRGA